MFYETRRCRLKVSDRKMIDEPPLIGEDYGCGSPDGLVEGLDWNPENGDHTRSNERTLSFLSKSLHVPRNSVCGTLHSVTSMRSGEATRKNTTKLLENPNLFARALNEKLTGPWIEHAFEKRECIKYIATNGSERCGCGRVQAAHSQLALSRFAVFPSSPSLNHNSESWSIADHTQTSPTDAFGTILFQGGAHAHKAQYVRLGYDSDAADVMYLMEKVWGLQPPKLVITVHGGLTNFSVQEKLGRLFREGLLKAAQTTGAWILTGGLDAGVVRHVAQALDDAGISARMRSKIVTIGIAPWGVIKRRERLVSKDQIIQYDSHGFGSSNGMEILNDRHSYFLLADNGTSGRYGADLHLRRNLENFLAGISLGNGTRKVPVVCAVLEGGRSTINAMHQYLTQEPDIPVIVCDGSGRASDLVAFAVRYIDNDGTFPPEVTEQLLALISTVFPDNVRSAEQFLNTIAQCARRKDLLTVFRYGEDQKEDIDHAILTAVLKRQNLSLPDQLALTLSWNRVDVARSCLFVGGKNWPINALHAAMSEALRLDRVEFVECLLENGVSMKNFLSITTLEQLYNLDDDTQHSVRFLVEHATPTTYLTLPDIGTIVEKLMGNAYKHYYTSREFKGKYEKFRKKDQLSRLSNLHIRLVTKTAVKQRRKSGESRMQGSEEDSPPDFLYPFNDLMVWAVLTRRPEMARCMWLHGEDAMAKSLAAMRLYKSIARVAEQEYLEVEVANKLKVHAEQFRAESLELLDFCYREDNEETLKLLTAELPHWGQHNCLSLAVLANNKTFLAHPCCQMLLAELWHGSLRVRSGSNIRVLSALLCPPAALALAFKTPAPVRPKIEDEDSEDEAALYHLYGSTSDTIQEPTVTANNDRQRGSIGSMMSTHINRLFKTRSVKCRNGGTAAEEADELLEQGTLHKKVTIVSSKRNSIYESTTSLMRKPAPSLTGWAKLRAFYSAPITKFWSWCMAFHLFLMTSTYVLLIDFPAKPTKIEYGTFVYIIVFTFEHFRKLFTQETPKIKEKCRVFYKSYYNFLTLVALLLFLIGFGFRLNPLYRHSYGRVILSCSNVLWYMKVLEYLSVHPLLGPYIQMAAKMVISMCYIIILLLVTLMAFGVSRQAITYPHSTWSWLLVRNIFYKPYFMLYGEVYAGEIDTCGDDAYRALRKNGTSEGYNCVPGGWIPPILMTIFLLVANILLINMLIAIFNNIFNETNVRSQEVWLFQRYGQVMEYNDTPILPPPFTILLHIMYLVVYTCKDKCKRKAGRQKRFPLLDFSMKLILSTEELRDLHDFEEDCMDELTRKRTSKEKGTLEERWMKAIEQTELMSTRVTDLLQENFSLRSRLCDMESQMEWIVKAQKNVIECLKTKKESKDSSKGESTHSLPDAVEAANLRLLRTPLGYTSITDQILLVPPEEDRRNNASPLLSHLRMDHTLRKYDEARYQSPLTMRRPRLNSSSLSISQDMRDMDRKRSKNPARFDDDLPIVIVHDSDSEGTMREPWEDSS